MAVLTIDQNPSISDTIVFTLLTPDANGCFLTNPYKLNSIVVYYVKRDYTSGNTSNYLNKTYVTDQIKAAEVAEAIACANPTPENISSSKVLRAIAESNASVNDFYYNEASPVKIVGDDLYPAWLSTDLTNAFAELVETDENGNPIYGVFQYTWQPEGVREGDYFICWTWTPNIAGSTLSSHQRFSLMGDTVVTTSLPTHRTDPKKYKTLLDRYTPEMFKMVISNDDQTPCVLDQFNDSVAMGFTYLEDLANQIVDLQDANSIHEALIPYLSNFFNLKLKTDDPTRWRGQIKRAIPLYKMKGTKKALAEAFDQAAMKLLEFTQLWEVTSSYTWQESFFYDGTSLEFILEKTALPFDSQNFELWRRTTDWTQLNSNYVSFNTIDGLTTMTWIGDELIVNPITLNDGDEIRVLYKYANIPSGKQSTETYLRSLPLMDLRDEKDQIYPLKNWNTRVISEKDPMFQLIIPSRHPYFDFITYGKIRTEFAYSENIYNMEEYNGSIRNSKVPCDIDRDFIDPCSYCISSNYNVDLEIENLSDDRIIEAKEVLLEYTPFHAVLHSFNFIGNFNEFIESPREELEILLTYKHNDFVIAGENQMYFNRNMMKFETQGLNRQDLANQNQVLGLTPSIAYNDKILMFCPTMKLDSIGMNTDNNTVLKILAPSSLAGEYFISEPDGNVVTVDTVDLPAPPGAEPIANCNNIFANDNTINTCAFSFEIKNRILDGPLCNVAQDDLYEFFDESNGFPFLTAKSLFDVGQGTATDPWKISIPAYSINPFVIFDIRPDGKIILQNDGGLNALSGTVNNIVYVLLDENDNEISNGTYGQIHVTKRGRVTSLSGSLLPISNFIKLNYFFYINANDFLISGFVPFTNDQFYINDYNMLDMNGINLRVYDKILTNEIGYLSHSGINVQTDGDLESFLGIQNGENNIRFYPPNTDEVENNGFKENFLIFIGDDSYFITSINGNNPAGYTTMKLSGNSNYWKTLNAGGTEVNIDVFHYVKKSITIEGQPFDDPSHTFRTMDRSSRPVISYTNQDNVVTELSVPNDDAIQEFTKQNESVIFKIQYSDGKTEEGKL